MIIASNHRSLRTLTPLAAVIALLLGAGCATPPRSVRPVQPIFYPPDAKTARLQFLTSFDSPENIEPGPSSLLTFAAGAPPPKPGIAKPYGVEMRNGTIQVCDTVSGVIHILDLTRQTWTYFTPDGQGRLRKPINVRLDADGTRYVTDTARGQVVIFEPTGLFAGVLGTPGEMRPTDVALAKDRIYVADLKSETVRVYRKDSRELLFSIPREEDKKAAEAVEAKEREAKGEKDEAEEKATIDPANLKTEEAPRETKPNAKLNSPTNLALGPDGTLYVSDVGYYGVKRYDADGKFLGQIGRHGDAPGEFARNKGIAVDREQRLYVVDAAFENVQIFDAQSNLLLHFGEAESGAEGRMVLPAGLALSYENLDYFRPFVAPGRDIEYIVLVANQYGDSKISVYGLLRQPGDTR